MRAIVDQGPPDDYGDDCWNQAEIVDSESRIGVSICIVVYPKKVEGRPLLPVSHARHIKSRRKALRSSDVAERVNARPGSAVQAEITAVPLQLRVSRHRCVGTEVIFDTKLADPPVCPVLQRSQ